MDTFSYTKFKLRFAIICIGLGLLEGLIEKRLFTASGVVETLLITLPFLYFWFKYQTSRIISWYQVIQYTPPTSIRRRHDLLVTVSVKIVQPICMDVLYACFFLLLIKWMTPDSLGRIAEWIYSLYLFNEEYIKYPILAVVLLVGVFTLIRFLPDRSYRIFKKWTKRIGFPFRVAAILVLFINIDKGVSSRYIAWQLNKERPETVDKITFNASAAEEEQVKKIIRSYAEVIITKLDALSGVPIPPQPEAYYKVPPTENIHDFHADLKVLSDNADKEPTIRQDIYEGHAGSDKVYTSEEREVVDGLNNGARSAAARESLFTETPLYTAAFPGRKGNSSRLRDLYECLVSDQESIGPKPTDSQSEMLEDMICEGIGGFDLFPKLKASVLGYEFVKEKIFDAFNEKLVSGLFSLFKIKKTNRSVVHDITDVIAAECMKPSDDGLRYKDIYNFADNLQKVLPEYNRNFTNALALKTKLNGNGKLTDPHDLVELLDKFPNDQLGTDYKKVTPLIKAIQDKDVSAISTADVNYLNERLRADPDFNSVFHPALTQIELFQKVEQAMDENTVQCWKSLQAFPGLSQRERELVLENMQRAKKNESSKPYQPRYNSFHDLDGTHDGIQAPGNPWYHDYPAYHPTEIYTPPVEFHIPVPKESPGFWAELLEHIRL